ncbi:hypothetical protein AB0I37_26040 [Micromonospora purpureochromogenes]|uniref:hypothetical protein n=1 Tax=Micromonospora purpureochromogenes TaxID=47872 RepID=UPI0033DD88B0
MPVGDADRPRWVQQIVKFAVALRIYQIGHAERVEIRTVSLTVDPGTLVRSVAGVGSLVTGMIFLVLPKQQPTTATAGMVLVITGIALALRSIISRTPDMSGAHVAAVRSAIAAQVLRLSTEAYRQMLSAAPDADDNLAAADLTFRSTSLTWRPAAERDGRLRAPNEMMLGVSSGREDRSV